MSYAVLFFAGAFLCNCIPHLGAGLQGMPFPTPFAKPRGVGNSSPLVNVFWGVFNLCIGLYLLSRQPVMIGSNASCFALIAGGLAIATYLSVHFGRVRTDSQMRNADDSVHFGSQGSSGRNGEA